MSTAEGAANSCGETKLKDLDQNGIRRARRTNLLLADSQRAFRKIVVTQADIDLNVSHAKHRRMTGLYVLDHDFVPHPGVLNGLPLKYLLLERLAFFVVIIDLPLGATIPVLLFHEPRYRLAVQGVAFIYGHTLDRVNVLFTALQRLH